MATRRTTKTTKPASTAPKHVTVIDGNDATITPVDQADIPTIAALLLTAADDPTQVRTTTSPTGWVTTKTIATKAGLD